MDYEHHNVLSDNINGTWGNAIMPDTLVNNQLQTLNHSFQLPDPNNEPTYEINNLALIGFVLDRNTEEVIQSHFIELN